MAEKEACADIVASVTADLQKERQTKTEIKNTKGAVEAAAAAEETESESEYEEIIEEVTDDSSAEGEEVEEEDDDDQEEELIDDDDDKDDDKDEKIVESEKKTVAITKTVETKVVSDKPTEKSVETNEQPTVEKPKVETSKVNKEEEEEEEEAKEQSKSLLLPLLQGLLHKNMLPNRNPTNNQSNKINPSSISGSSGNKLESNHSGSDITNISVDHDKMASKKSGTSGLTVHHVEDSGTESGEDLKFIAAGLRDSLQMNSIDDQDEIGLITEVTRALNRLESSLLEGKDLKLDAKKRNALLTLVARLQTGLISPEKITAPTPAPGQTADGDTELSSPEGDNRRGIRPGHQRFAKRRNRANRHTVGVSREELADARRYIEELVLMESVSNCTTPDSSNLATPPDHPYSIEKQNSAGAVLGNAVQEPSTLFRPNQFVPNYLKDRRTDQVTPSTIQLREKKPKSTTVRQSVHLEENIPVSEMARRPYSEAYPRDKKVEFPVKTDDPQNRAVIEKNMYNKTHHSTQPAWGSVFNGIRPSAYQPPEVSSQNNRFVNKKLMMKRANTIDIPKPMKYMNDMESDSEAEERGVSSTKSIGLRGTVQVTVKNTPRHVVPPFKPKTDNDLKFLAFIQKQSPDAGLGWNNPTRGKTSNMANNWCNKFGNIKNSFESGAVSTSSKPPMPSTSSSARNFWKKTETTDPIFLKQTSKLSFTSRANDKVKPPWSEIYEPESPKIVVPKPIPVNKFSHAPMSVFKPISPISHQIEPLKFDPVPAQHNPPPRMNASFSEPSLYALPTKPMSFLGQLTRTNRSPTLPWAGQATTGNRVHSLATSKFENKPQRYQSARIKDQTYQQRMSGYNRLEQKRPSLPNNAKYDADLQAPQMIQNMMHDAIIKEFPPLTYTSTDYTQPSMVSTYTSETCTVRPDSLTNPEAEPLVLTSDRPFISPHDPSESLLTSSNYTQNEVSDSEFDTDSITEYKAESKIMRGPVSQQAVTVGSRTMRRGDEFGKNSKEAKSLLKVMKTIKAPSAIVTAEGRSYQAPKVESVLATTAEVNRFTHEVSSAQNNNNIVQGYNPLYQQPNATKIVEVPNYQQPSSQVPLGKTIPMYQPQPNININYANARGHAPQINEQVFCTDENSIVNYRERPMTNYHEPPRIRNPELPINASSYSALKYEIPPYKEPQKNFSAYPVENYQEISRPEIPRTLKTYPSYQEEHCASSKKTQDKIMKEVYSKQSALQILTKVSSAPTSPEKRSEPISTKTASDSSSTPTTPKDESIPKFKKFGPAQPHSYRPNSYQNPLAEAHRKFSEPNVRTSQSTIRKNITRSTTIATKFIAPQIVETPSSPLATGKIDLPSNVIYNNVHRTANYESAFVVPTRFPINPLSKSDSWHQICQQNTSTKSSSPNNLGHQLRRVKSGHSLDIPKMYEAGINKSQIVAKQKTVAAYFSGQKSPNSLSRNSSQTNIAETTSSVTMKKSSINRIRSSEKASIGNQNPSSGLSRSQTMPHMASIHLLDESNVEDAFEELLKAS